MQCAIFDLKITNFVNVFSQFWYHFHLEKNVALYGTLNFVHVFSLMRYYLPFQKGVALQSRFGLKFCLKWSNGFGEYLKMFVNVFPLFRFYLRLGKGVTLYLNKLESLPKKLCAKLIKIGAVVLRSEGCTERQTDRRKDGKTDRRKRGRTHRQTVETGVQNRKA